VEANTRLEAPTSPKRGLARGMITLGLVLAPALLAIASTPGFTTQDGPAHVYSARVLNASLSGHSPFASTFRVDWEPLPNWVGHLVTMLAVAALPAEVANRVVSALTLVAFASSIVILRWVVAGSRGIETSAVLAAVLDLNVTWLLGFTSFLLGATVGAFTLATWWSGRDRFGPARSLLLAVLLVVNYFCHPISLGLTLAALAILAAVTPGTGRLVRSGWMVLSGIPLVPLTLAYRSLTRSGGGLEPVWKHWSPSFQGFVSQIGWVDPLSLAAKSVSPFDAGPAMIPAVLLAPAVWAVVALGVLFASSWPRRGTDRRGWLIIAVGLVVVGMVSPDTLGVKHGHFLPQRIVLLGLVAIVPWLDLGMDRLAAKGALAALLVALAVQTAFIWEYAQSCHDRVSPFLRIAARFEAGTRSGTLLNAIRGRFRANPLLHADGLIAASSDALFWTNYETAQYYFPVKVRADVDHPVATSFEQVAILDEPGDLDRRIRLWRDLIRDHGAQIDKIVEWQSDTILDAVIDRGYQVTDREGPFLRVWSRLPSAR